jgi:hypothetical protein
VRHISPASLAILAQSEGVEPINFIEVRWRNATSRRYADQAVKGILEGKLLEMGNLENVIDISGSSSSQSITVKLDDTDGTIKAIIDNIDIHKTPVFVYQWFKGLPIGEAFIIFEGEISTPIVWSEPERTVTFEVLSKLTDNEIGFSAEEGDFEYIPPNLVGRAWPLVFGTSYKVPSLRANDPPSGAIAEALGSGDQSVNKDHFFRLVQNNYAAYYKARDSAITCLIYARDALATAQTLAFAQTINNSARANNIPGAPQEDLTGQIQEMNQLAKEYNARAIEYQVQMDEILRTGLLVWEFETDPQAQALEKPSIPIVNGNLFPQGTPLTVNINNGQAPAAHTGVFNGTTFTIVTRENPLVQELGLTDTGPVEVSENNVAEKYQSLLSSRTLWVANGGSMVTVSSRTFYPMTYIVSLMHVQVPTVWAYRNLNGQKILSIVPPSYYSVQHIMFNTLAATLIKMNAPLSSYANQGWEDDLYCDIVSPVGPNIVDIMKWVIENYTGHAWDTTSFNHVRTLLEPFPANFAKVDRPNVVAFLQELAFQSRCAIWYSNGVFYLKYLSEESTPVDTITDDDVEFGSLEMTCTPTEELVTKLTVTWKPDGVTDSYRSIFRHNVQKYGTLEGQYDFYIYNVLGLVEKSAVFWIVRKANTWKEVSFTTFLTKLRLEPYDMVTLSLSSKHISNDPVNCMVKSVQYDSDNNRLTLNLWVPVRFGEMDQYPFAMPANISETVVFPTAKDLAGGTQSSAGGQIIDQKPLTGGSSVASRANMDRGANSGFTAGVTSPGYVPLSDQGSQPDTSVRTFVNPNVDTSLTIGQRTTKQSKQWTIKDPKPPVFSEVKPGVWPGYIVSQVEGNIYDVEIYYQGLDGTPQRINARAAKIREGDTFAFGTPVLICRSVWTDGDALLTENVIVPPIWAPDLADYEG